jgi:hypothetical protein
MVKTNLPVILLRVVVLLPYSEIRLEVNNDVDKEIFKLAEEHHEGHILIVPLLIRLMSPLMLKNLLRLPLWAKLI